jgi:hypothetical protein
MIKPMGNGLTDVDLDSRYRSDSLADCLHHPLMIISAGHIAKMLKAREIPDDRPSNSSLGNSLRPDLNINLRGVDSLGMLI